MTTLYFARGFSKSHLRKNMSGMSDFYSEIAIIDSDTDKKGNGFPNHIKAKLDDIILRANHYYFGSIN